MYFLCKCCTYPVIHVSKAVINDVTVEDMDHFRLEFVKVGFYRLLVVTFSDVEVFKPIDESIRTIIVSIINKPGPG